jgi:hypothetical protein
LTLRRWASRNESELHPTHPSAEMGKSQGQKLHHKFCKTAREENFFPFPWPCPPGIPPAYRARSHLGGRPPGTSQAGRETRHQAAALQSSPAQRPRAPPFCGLPLISLSLSGVPSPLRIPVFFNFGRSLGTGPVPVNCWAVITLCSLLSSPPHAWQYFPHSGYP